MKHWIKWIDHRCSSWLPTIQCRLYLSSCCFFFSPPSSRLSLVRFYLSAFFHFKWPTKAMRKLVFVVCFIIGLEKRQGSETYLIPPNLYIIRPRNKQTKQLNFLWNFWSVMTVNLFCNWHFSLFHNERCDCNFHLFDVLS